MSASASAPRPRWRTSSLQVLPGEAQRAGRSQRRRKSTLVSLLTGLTRPDRRADPVRRAGRSFRVQPLAPAYAVACVYQSPRSSRPVVAENLFPQSPGRAHLWKALRARAQKLLETMGDRGRRRDRSAQADGRAAADRENRPGAVFRRPFIILDEPTAQLDGAGIRPADGWLAAMRSAGSPSCSSRTICRRSTRPARTVTVLRDAAHHQPHRSPTSATTHWSRR